MPSNINQHHLLLLYVLLTSHCHPARLFFGALHKVWFHHCFKDLLTSLYWRVTPSEKKLYPTVLQSIPILVTYQHLGPQGFTYSCFLNPGYLTGLGPRGQEDGPDFELGPFRLGIAIFRTLVVLEIRGQQPELILENGPFKMWRHSKTLTSVRLRIGSWKILSMTSVLLIVSQTRRTWQESF